MLAVLDRPVDQVLIEARIVIATTPSPASSARASASAAPTTTCNFSSRTRVANTADRNSQVTTDMANQTATNAYSAALNTCTTCLSGGGTNCGSAPIAPILRGSTITRGLMTSLARARSPARWPCRSLNGGYAARRWSSRRC